VSGLALDLPLGRGVVADGGAFDWLLAQMRSGEAAFANDLIALRPRSGERVVLSFDGGGPLLSLPAPTISGDTVEVSPGLCLQPADQSRLTDFLADHWLALDHVGINLSHRDLAEAHWQLAIAAIGAVLPAWRLEIGAANDIVMVVSEESGRVSTVELVYDRAATHSSLHICARLSVPRALVDVEFPTPYGAYKPGDEAFFRSVALPYMLGVPAYLDLSFSDAQMAPWPQIVATMGKRVA
jgi:hypothetical protein